MSVHVCVCVCVRAHVCVCMCIDNIGICNNGIITVGTNIFVHGQSSLWIQTLNGHKPLSLH